ncbi:MAG: Retron-type reverse transcriptase [Parcubacteria group bacterium GW2011_GWB1_52_7]|nr:MAG: Retron-type reverse transcriptase [Parcubacteria group bacterium GW2011_GWB1_52_7]
MGGGHQSLFEQIISFENIFGAWKEFKRGKMRKAEVLEFYSTLEEHLFEIRESLRSHTYRPQLYVSFFVTDPKLRHIHKASVRDRVVHQAIFRVLYPLFDASFIHDSYSCREGKGTHRGVRQLARYLRKISANHKRPAYALKCDIRKFFDSIDHAILIKLLERRVHDTDAQQLLTGIIKSFETMPGKGLPLGNVTSQLFANVYMNELDQWTKHELKARLYLRYCDDFIILHQDKKYLVDILPKIARSLKEKLQLELHPNKVTIRKISQGVDFLGYVVLPHAIMVRTRTKLRMFRTLAAKPTESVRQSYLGMLSHANARKLSEKIKALW